MLRLIVPAGQWVAAGVPLQVKIVVASGNCRTPGSGLKGVSAIQVSQTRMSGPPLPNPELADSANVEGGASVVTASVAG